MDRLARRKSAEWRHHHIRQRLHVRQGLDTYARHGGAPTVYSITALSMRFALDAFASLYGALDASCSHFVFLDTDEFLTLIVDGRHARTRES